MTPELAQLIEELRADLAEEMPASLAYAQIGDPAPAEAVPADLPDGLREFLMVADGLRAGAFELRSTSSLADIQYFVDHAPDFSPIPEEKANWLVVATASDEPIFMERGTGSIWYFPAPDTEWFQAETFAEVAPDLDAFVHYYVLGPGYAELVRAGDRWHQFLDRQGLLDEADDTEPEQ